MSIFLCLILASLFLSSCVSGIWTGASLIYDRHNLYKKLDDFQLASSANRALYKDNLLKCDDCEVDVAVFNGDVLLVGSLPSRHLRHEAVLRAKTVPGHRRLFNQIRISRQTDDVVQDSWITAKIRSQIVADSDIDPNQFKVVTSNHVVYLMGDVMPAQARIVIHIARDCVGVKRVVTLFRYYQLTEKVS